MIIKMADSNDDNWNPSAIASVAALIIAILAMIIALAQAIQQYFITGQLIRICDSVVFGPMPGQGRRVWQLSQFRFRVLYSIPQISIKSSLWPVGGGLAKSYAIGRLPLPLLESAPKSIGKRALLANKVAIAGEASWVSFCRAIESWCGESVRMDLVEQDADRCPSDLVSAPMQVSMRDVIVMGLRAGMEITSASFEGKSVEMQGEVGTITSSKHAVLGPILHFNPRRTTGIDDDVNPQHHRGFISVCWLARTWNVCSVAGRPFNRAARRTARRLDDRWISDQDHIKSSEGRSNDDTEESKRGRKKFGTRDIAVPRRTEDDTPETYQKGSQESKNSGKGKAATAGKEKRVTAHRLAQDGIWTITIPPELPETSKSKRPEQPTTQRVPENSSGGLTTSQGSNQVRSRRPRPTVEDVSDEGEDYQSKDANNRKGEASAPFIPALASPVGYPSAGITSGLEVGPPPALPYDSNPEDDPNMLDRVQAAKALQASRAAKLRELQNDKKLVQDSMKRGVMTSPYDEAKAITAGAGMNGQYLLPYNPDPSPPQPHDQPTASSNTEPGDPPNATTEEELARERESKRAQDREAREREREKRNKAREQAENLTFVDVYWFSQIDVLHGYWATPWHNEWTGTPSHGALTGCITVVLEALLGFLGTGYIVYTGSNWSAGVSFSTTESWMCSSIKQDGEGHDYNYTYPAYAHNARGGVIASGDYQGCRIPAFSRDQVVIPMLELAQSYAWQVDPHQRLTTTSVKERNVELMRLDSWLSYVGRLDEISDGPHRLLRQTPALLALLMKEFEKDFENIDLSAFKGGLQDIQGLAANVMDWLLDEELTEAEQLFVLVALLRAVKVAQCVRSGPDTFVVEEILRRDVQAHLV
ncbi:hypothetical protein QBC43DRAFT_320176 [Cladorrhinum sp. PSN259]|nr:hypothetical protein QBC43DRAFT_320176 [Cladorrhinum sp. PSN259]